MGAQKHILAMLFLFAILLDVNCDCILDLQKDFDAPSPVYFQNGVFLAPNFKGVISLRRTAKITVACPGDKKHVVLGNATTSAQVIDVHCMSNSTFKSGKWQGQFRDIKCDALPWFTTEVEGACYGGNTLYKVGYKVNDRFHPVYSLCFDKNLLTSLYSVHYLTPTSRFNQGGTRRPQFIEGSLFGKVRMSELYKTKNQITRLRQVLGPDMDKEYISKTQFLNRGHLAPRGDFTMSAVQRATFHYANVAPQWMRANAGDWAALEDALRRRAQTMNTTLTIYTGTAGVLRLPNSKGIDTEIYLTEDENNNPLVAVPLYFFKLAYNPHKKTATAFVTINSSFYNTSVTEKLTFCDDICDGESNFKWLRWRADGAHSFCCKYNDFVKTIRVLPKLKVNGDFY